VRGNESGIGSLAKRAGTQLSTSNQIRDNDACSRLHTVRGPLFCFVERLLINGGFLSYCVWARRICGHGQVKVCSNIWLVGALTD
jgi:hypothetical protein